MTRKINLNQVQNVGPNQRATVRLPLGVTYNKLVIFTEGNITAAMLSNIVLKLNGSERMRWKTQAQLQARNSYNGGNSSTTALELDFVERNAKDEAAQTLGAIAATNEAGIQDAVLEFDIGNYTNSTASVVKVVAEVDQPSRNRLIVRNRMIQKVLAGATEEQIIIPSGKNGELVKRIYIYGTLAQIDNVRVRREGADEFEALTVAQNEYFQKTYGKLPQAGLMVIDFTEHNLQGHMLNTSAIVGSDGKAREIQNLDIRMKTNAAGTFDIYVESVTTSDRP